MWCIARLYVLYKSEPRVRAYSGLDPHQPIRDQLATETGPAHYMSGSVIGWKYEKHRPFNVPISDWFFTKGGTAQCTLRALTLSTAAPRSAPAWRRNILQQTVRFSAKQGLLAPVGCWSLTWLPRRKRANRMIVTPASNQLLSHSQQLRSTLARSQSSGSPWQ